MYSNYINDDEIEMAEQIHSYLRKYMIFERNKLMAQRIKDLIGNNTDTSFFFAFGVDHFIGRNSVVDMLEQSNISVERLPPDIDIQNLQSLNTTPKPITIPKSNQPEVENCSCNDHDFFGWILCILSCALGL